MNVTPFIPQGSHMCRCKDGFTGNGVACRDVNECLTNNGGCDQNAQCVNTEGSFKVESGVANSPHSDLIVYR